MEPSEASLEAAAWNLIESDPAVFTEICRKIGVEDVDFVEVWNFNEEGLSELISSIRGNIFGLIFLFNWQKKASVEQESPASDLVDRSADAPFFASLVIQNSCATNAILSVLLNQDKKLHIGSALQDLKDFSASFDPNMRGLAISNNDVFRQSHNSFKALSSFEFIRDSATKQQGGDAFHYTAYIPWNSHIYELDGLNSGPLKFGACPEGNGWIFSALPHVQKRMQCTDGEENKDLRFALMAVVSRQRPLLLKELEEKRQLAETEDGRSDLSLHTSIGHLEHQLEEESAKEVRWNRENQLRRHDLVPFLLCCLKHLSRKGKLTESLRDAVDSAAYATKSP